MNITTKACMTAIGIIMGFTVANELDLIPVPKLLVTGQIVVTLLALVAVNTKDSQ